MQRMLVHCPSAFPALSLIPASVGYIVPVDFPSGRLVISDESGQAVSFRFALEQPAVTIQYDGIGVRLVSVTTIDGQIRMRRYRWAGIGG